MPKVLLVPLLALACAAALWTGRVQAAHENVGCRDCHVVHGRADQAGGPLWSDAHTQDGLPIFTLYSSGTFDALQTDIGQPDGATKLCLGCHDGSYPGLQEPGQASAVIGAADLANMHPVSFTYDSALAARAPGGRLRDPAITLSGLGGTIRDDLLDANSRMQCSSCHDVHATGRGEHMLRYDSAAQTDGLLCRVCHDK